MAELKCPHCGREFVRRVARGGFLDNFLSSFYVYPFKCQLCGVRFRYLQWGVRYARVEEDRREYDRMEMNFPVSFYGQNVSGKGIVVEVSMGGCTFRSNAKIDPGVILNLSLQISKDVPPVIVDSAMVRTVRAGTVGVEFLLWQQSERERLQLFVRGLLIGRGVELDQLENHPESVLRR